MPNAVQEDADSPERAFEPIQGFPSGSTAGLREIGADRGAGPTFSPTVADLPIGGEPGHGKEGRLEAVTAAKAKEEALTTRITKATKSVTKKTSLRYAWKPAGRSV